MKNVTSETNNSITECGTDIKVEQPAVSVIIPIYNVEKYVRQCIESAISQTLKNIEIILVDDGSTDNCGSICDEYAAADSRIKVIHKANGGLVSARKAGIKAATGRYIGFIDGDDWADLNLFEYMYDLIERYDVAFVGMGYMLEYPDGKKNSISPFEEGCYKGQEYEDKIVPRMLGYKSDNLREMGMSYSLCNKLLRPELLTKYYNELTDSDCIGEDCACVLSYAVGVDSVYISNECMYHYRQSVESSLCANLKLTTDMSYMISRNLEIIRRNCEKSRYRDALKGQFDRLYVSNCCGIAPQLLDDKDSGYILQAFGGIKNGEKVILYGAGRYGRKLYGYLTNMTDADVVMWVDKNYANMPIDWHVQSPQLINTVQYDKILIGLIKSRKTIKDVRMFLENMGIDKDRIRFLRDECYDNPSAVIPHNERAY